MRRVVWAVALLALLVFVPPASAAPSGHYIPKSGDRVLYAETITLTDGQGNYSGYSEDSFYNGSINVTAVASNGTESAVYWNAGIYRNNDPYSAPFKENGSFTFSANTYDYVLGTDNQTGLDHSGVWFYMNNSLGVGQTFSPLETPVSVVSLNQSFADPASPTGYWKSIYVEGSGTGYSSDSYGNFNTTYTWQIYYDPGTGYVVGYIYTEVDRDGIGDGFTYTDTITETGTTGYALTSAAAPAAPPASPAIPWTTIIIVVVIVVVLVAVIAAALSRRRRGGMGRAPLPRHSGGGSLAPPPLYTSPPPVNLIPRDQPMVQQIVLKETVKVPCQFCGTLIDSTATVCPKCGAPRT